MRDRLTVKDFKEELTQLATVLEPFARSIKCLESSHSTLSDVYVFWLAVIARFRDTIKSIDGLVGVGLPKSVVEDITSILNGRHTEMFQGRAVNVYLAALFLDIRMYSSYIHRYWETDCKFIVIGYCRSDVLLRHPAQLSAETWGSQRFTSGVDLLPDHDLRQSFPAYTMTGDYLVELLGRIYNKDPDAPLFSRYANWTQIETAFRNQLMLFTRGLGPFHRVPKLLAEHSYWKSLRTIPTAELLAHLGMVLRSIVPNSMAEERSMSTITKLNTPDRASQKVSTLVDMVAIRQYYKRKENQDSQVSWSIYMHVSYKSLHSTRDTSSSTAHYSVCRSHSDVGGYTKRRCVVCDIGY